MAEKRGHCARSCLLRDHDAVLDRWAHHFADIEGGTLTTFRDLASQFPLSEGSHSDVPLSDLPSRLQWESAFKKLPAGKAPGADSLSNDFVRLAPAAMASSSYTLCALRLPILPASLFAGGVALSARCTKGSRRNLCVALVGPSWYLRFCRSAFIHGPVLILWKPFALSKLMRNAACQEAARRPCCPCGFAQPNITCGKGGCLMASCLQISHLPFMPLCANSSWGVQMFRPSLPGADPKEFMRTVLTLLSLLCCRTLQLCHRSFGQHKGSDSRTSCPLHGSS